MNTATPSQDTNILQFPIEARRAAVAASRRFAGKTLPDFVEFAVGGASYHEDAIREDEERRRRGH